MSQSGCMNSPNQTPASALTYRCRPWLSDCCGKKSSDVRSRVLSALRYAHSEVHEDLAEGHGRDGGDGERDQEVGAERMHVRLTTKTQRSQRSQRHK